MCTYIICLYIQQYSTKRSYTKAFEITIYHSLFVKDFAISTLGFSSQRLWSAGSRSKLSSRSAGSMSAIRVAKKMTWEQLWMKASKTGETLSLRASDRKGCKGKHKMQVPCITAKTYRSIYSIYRQYTYSSYIICVYTYISLWIIMYIYILIQYILYNCIKLFIEYFPVSGIHTPALLPRLSLSISGGLIAWRSKGCTCRCRTLQEHDVKFYFLMVAPQLKNIHIKKKKKNICCAPLAATRRARSRRWGNSQWYTWFFFHCPGMIWHKPTVWWSNCSMVVWIFKLIQSLEWNGSHYVSGTRPNSSFWCLIRR